MAQEGVEPSASLVLGESGLPIAYRAEMSCTQYPGWDSNPQAPGFKPGRSAVGVPGPFEAEAVGLEPTSGSRRHLFSRQVPDPAGSLPVLTPQFRGLESNQRPPRSERGVTTNRNCPGVFLVLWNGQSTLCLGSGRRIRTSTA